MPQSFAERIRNEAINYAYSYQHNFADYEFAIFSGIFQHHQYYILNFQPQNYLHLIGVNSLISPSDFFQRCYNKTLTLDDFDFNKGKNPKSTQGSVRRKINALAGLINLFSSPIYVQEDFKKNNVACALATTDANLYTLGMVNNQKHQNVLYPMSLMKGYQIDKTKQGAVDLVLKRTLGQPLFDKIVVGNKELLDLYLNNGISISTSPKID